MSRERSDVTTLADALRVAVNAAQVAGALLREEFHRPDSPHRADGGHSSLDRNAEELIREPLTSAFPDWGYRGEETLGKQSRGAREATHLWLVDPNDGTSAFLDGFRSSAVSIAVLRDGVPVLGVVYAFAAPDDDGDLFAWAEGCGPLTRNGRPVQREVWPTALTPETIVCVSHYADRHPAANQACVAPGRFLKVPGIAYRLALVAAGEGDAGVSLSSPGDWDYAAGHALLRAVGGELVDQSGRAVTYSAAGESHTSFCFGGAPTIVGELCRRPWHEVGSAPRRTAKGSLALVGLEPGRAVADAGLLRRAQGSLLGQLAGDSLGGLVEFRSAAAIAAVYPNGPRKLVDGGTWGTLAGQPTDDSEEALMLARSIVAAGGYDHEAAARAYREWYESGPFDVGTTTSRAMSAPKESDVAAQTVAAAMLKAASRSSQANGSLMRVSPLGIWGHGLSARQLADMARTDSALTHPNVVCQEACAAFAVAVAHAVASGDSPREVYGHVLDWAEGDCRDRGVLDTLRRAADEPPADYSTHQGWVLVALQNAYYQLLHAPSLEEGVVRTVAAGGDTDTNAAIAGALLGAVHGRDAVPTQWRQMVLTCRPLKEARNVRRPRPEPFWPVDALELAERLVLACPEQPAADHTDQ
jgi:ADP-ribosyl-[dinitrogen reductase] hydrolase